MDSHTALRPARTHRDDPLTASYLDALGLVDLLGEPPTTAGLMELHRAHAQRFAHDTVWIARRRIPEVEPRTMAAALIGGEGGVCTQLGLGFGWLLDQLGYDVRVHEARVVLTFSEEFRAWPLHPVLTVGLEGLRWYVDVGMGNGMLDAIACVDGSYEQPGGFGYSLHRVEDQVWEFTQDPRMRGVRRLRFDEGRTGFGEAFRDGYREMVTSPESPYRTTIGASRREVDGVVVLTGNALTRQGVHGRTRTRLTSAAEWEAVLREEFHLGLPEWTSQERDRLWGRIVGEAA